MSEANKKFKRNSLIYPLFSIAPSPSHKLLSPKALEKLIKPLHKRAQSDIVNPYLDHRDLHNLKASTKLSRQNNQETKTSPQISKKIKLSSTTKPKASHLNVKKSEKMLNPDLILTELQGDAVFKAPKRFSNQFFIDVYDNDGNHDRVAIEDSMEIYNELESNKSRIDPCIIFNISNPEKELSPTKKSIKAPENSYIEKSIGEIPDDSLKKLSVGQEFYCKLNKILNEQGQDYQSEETTSISGGKSRV